METAARPEDFSADYPGVEKQRFLKDLHLTIWFRSGMLGVYFNRLTRLRAGQ